MSKMNLSLLEISNFIENLKEQKLFEAPILIQGESGTGKEVIAREIHRSSPHRDGPFIPVNCSSIPKDLLESKFFGHLKGAFTGADTDNKGLFQAAHGGTIFLDEIGDMSLSLQPKLLRAIQFKSFYPLGSHKEVTVDVRIIAATNCNLEKLVQENRFRSDLFYRLNVLSLYLKPLREKKQFIPEFLYYFLKKYAQQYKTAEKHLTDKAYQQLLDYHWPGNIRELENVVHRMTILSKKNEVDDQDLAKILPELQSQVDVPEKIFNEAAESIDFYKVIAAIEKKILLQALTKHRWNRSQAARYLHMNRPTLIQKMKKLQIQDPKELETQTEIPSDLANSEIY